MGLIRTVNITTRDVRIVDKDNRNIFIIKPGCVAYIPLSYALKYAVGQGFVATPDGTITNMPGGLRFQHHPKVVLRSLDDQWQS